MKKQEKIAEYQKIDILKKKMQQDTITLLEVYQALEICEELQLVWLWRRFKHRQECMVAIEMHKRKLHEKRGNT